MVSGLFHSAATIVAGAALGTAMAGVLGSASTAPALCSDPASPLRVGDNSSWYFDDDVYQMRVAVCVPGECVLTPGF